jgi:hypothetical protein
MNATPEPEPWNSDQVIAAWGQSPPPSPPPSQNHLPLNYPSPEPLFLPEKSRAGANSLQTAIDIAFGMVGTRGSSTGNEIPDYTILLETPAPDKGRGMPLIKNIVGYCNTIERTVLYKTNSDAYGNFATRNRNSTEALREALIESGVVVYEDELSPKRLRMTAGFADLTMVTF